MLCYKTPPYTKQREVIEAVIGNDLQYWALLCEMGTGKTKMSIDIATNLFYEKKIELVVVVAPNAVFGQWITEGLPEHGSNYLGLTWNRSSSKQYRRAVQSFKAAKGCLKWFAVNTEAFSREGSMQPVLWDILCSCERFGSGRFKALLIIDEASAIKNPDSGRSKELAKWASAFRYRSILTGTPSPQSLSNIWNLYETLDKNFWGMSYLAFRNAHVLMYRRRVEFQKNGRTLYKYIDHELDATTWKRVKGTIAAQRSGSGEVQYTEIANRFDMSVATVLSIEAQERYDPYINVERITEAIKPYTFTLKKSDCKDMPPKIFQKVPLTLSKAQREALYQMKRENIVIGETGILTITNKSQLLIRAMQICGGFLPLSTDTPGVYTLEEIKGGNPKLERLLLEIDELGGEQAIVWAHFNAEQLLLQKTFTEKGIAASYYIGDKSPEALEREKARFVAGETQIMLMSPNMGAYGINLVNATVQLWYSRGWSVEKRLQALDRSHRITSTKPVIYKDLVYLGTVDDLVLAALSRGQDINQLIMSMEPSEFFNVQE